MKNYQVEVTRDGSTTHAYVSARNEREARDVAAAMFGEGSRVGYVAPMSNW